MPTSNRLSYSMNSLPRIACCAASLGPPPQVFCASMPPSTTTTAPLTYEAAGRDKAERHVGHLLGITVTPKRHTPSGELVLASSGIPAVMPV